MQRTVATRRLPDVAGPDFETQIKQLQATMHTIEQVLDLATLRGEIADLGEQVAAPDLWDDQANAQRVTGRLSVLQSDLDRFTELQDRLDDLGILLELAQEESDADSMREAESELRKIHKAVEALEVRTLLSGEYDAREALLTIRSGAGGVDAADFAETLMRMYTRWAERNKYPVEVFDTSYAEEAGLKSATFAIHAPYAYGTLSVEAGTHRLVRISPFDNQGRRQTSFAAVEVVPLLEQTDEIEIPEDEVRIDVYRSSGPGGHRRGRLVPEREEPAAEQGQRHGDPQGQAAGAEEGRGAGRARRAARRRTRLVG
jgi:peptide chain release factor 2